MARPNPPSSAVLVRRQAPPRRAGFALILTLSISALLVVLVTGLLLTVRSASGNLAATRQRSELEATAQCAMRLAMGQVQRTLGPDTRISARLAVADTSPDTEAVDGVSQPDWLGVWRSWDIAKPLDAEGNPVPNGWPNLTSPPDYQDEHDSRFVEALVSGDPAWKENRDAVLQEPAVEVATFGPRGEGDSARQVTAPWQPLTDTSAAAWWVDGHAERADLRPVEFAEASPELEVWYENQVPGTVNLAGDARIQESSDPAERDALRARVVTPESLNLVWTAGEPAQVAETAADYTVDSTGVLANVAQGGLRRAIDLWADPDVDRTLYFDQEQSPQGTASTLYGNIQENVGDTPFRIGFDPRVPSFKIQQAWNFWRQDTDATSKSMGLPRVGGQPQAAMLSRTELLQRSNAGDLLATDNPRAIYPNIARPRSLLSLPIVAKTQYFCSIYTPRNSNSDTTRNHDLIVVVDPVITLWNRSNAPLRFPQDSNFITSLVWPPLQLRYQIPPGRVETQDFFNLVRRNVGSGGGWAFMSVGVDGAQLPVLAPGESVVLTLDRDVNQAFVLRDRQGLPIRRGWRVARGLRLDTGFDVPGNQNITMAAALHQYMEGGLVNALINSVGWQGFGLSKTSGTGATGTSGAWDSLLGTALARFNGEIPDEGRNWHQSLARLYGFESAGSAPNWSSPAIGPGDFPTIRPAQSATPESMQPFLIMETVMNAVTGNRQGAVPYLLANPANFIAELIRTTKNQDLVHQQMQFEMRPVTSWDGQIPVGENGEGFVGGGRDANTGQSFAVLEDVPLAPLVNPTFLRNGLLEGMNQVVGMRNGAGQVDPNAFRNDPIKEAAQTWNGGRHMVGRSWADPRIAGDRVWQQIPGSTAAHMKFWDTPYFANLQLWDGWYASGLAARPDSLSNPDSGPDSGTLAADFRAGTALSNPRLRPFRPRTTPITESNAAAEQLVTGAFNVNSTSVNAWEALLNSRLNRPVLQGESLGTQLNAQVHEVAGAVFPRLLHNRAAPVANPVVDSEESWQTSRFLTDDQVTRLAEEIVKQVKQRGPFLSLAEFINRRLENSELGFSGALQSALQESGINADAAALGQPLAHADEHAFASAAQQYESTIGSPYQMEQGDVLQSIAPVLSARSDTFTVQIACRSGLKPNQPAEFTRNCEVVLQRLPDFVDDAQLPESLPTQWSEINKRFGRRVRVVSWRWVGSFSELIPSGSN